MDYRAVRLILLVTAITVFTMPGLCVAQMANERTDHSAGDNRTLRLVGTALTKDPSGSIAVIEFGEDGRQEIFRQGDFAEGILIKQVLRDRVLVETPEGEKTITMMRSRFSVAEQTVGVVNSTPIAYDPSLSMPVSYGPRPAGTRTHDTRYLDRKSVASLLANIDHVIQTVSIETATLYNRPVGVKVSSIEPGSIFSDMGLKNGEIIKEVNGEEIIHPEQAIAILRKLKEGSGVDIKVKGRRTRQIHLIIEG